MAKAGVLRSFCDVDVRHSRFAFKFIINHVLIFPLSCLDIIHAYDNIIQTIVRFCSLKLLELINQVIISLTIDKQVDR